MTIYRFGSKSDYDEEDIADPLYTSQEEPLQLDNFWANMDKGLPKDLNLLVCEKEKVKFDESCEGESQSNSYFDVSNVQINQERIDTSLPMNKEEVINLEQSSQGNNQRRNPFLDLSNIQIQGSQYSTKLQNIRKLATNGQENIRVEQFGEGQIKKRQRVEEDLCSVKTRKAQKIIERSCSHCETKTSTQWRMGPLRRNTLCNACGLRYKTKGLHREYRPVASPSFDDTKHSNYHKKVLRKGGYFD